MYCGVNPIENARVAPKYDVGRLQSALEAYIREAAPGVALNAKPFTGKNFVRLIGNPFGVKKEAFNEKHDLYNKDIAANGAYQGFTRPVGKVACSVFNANEDWFKFHIFDDEATATEFFSTCGATNKGDFILVNAHSDAGADIVHEAIHSYHGDDGRFDWFMNEGLTDWFAVDFAKSKPGREFPYAGGGLYGLARQVAGSLVENAGRSKVAKFFFGTTKDDKFSALMKGFSKDLITRAREEGNGPRSDVLPQSITPALINEAAQSL
jgi:hypothetical protein